MNGVLPAVASTAFAPAAQVVLLVSTSAWAVAALEIKCGNWVLQANQSSKVTGEGVTEVYKERHSNGE